MFKNSVFAADKQPFGDGILAKSEILKTRPLTLHTFQFHSRTGYSNSFLSLATNVDLRGQQQELRVGWNQAILLSTADIVKYHCCSSWHSVKRVGIGYASDVARFTTE